MAIQTLKNFLINWGPAIIWAAFIFILSSHSSLPGPEIIWWDFIFKKSAHMFVFGVLFFLIQRAINVGQLTQKFSLAFFLTFLYACSDELHQSFIQGRTALITDIGYDMLGASLVLLKLKSLV